MRVCVRGAAVLFAAERGCVLGCTVGETRIRGATRAAYRAAIRATNRREPGGLGVHESTRAHKCPPPPVFASAWLLASRGHSCLSARRWCDRSGMTGIA